MRIFSLHENDAYKKSRVMDFLLRNLRVSKYQIFILHTHLIHVLLYIPEYFLHFLQLFSDIYQKYPKTIRFLYQKYNMKLLHFLSIDFILIILF